MRESSRGLKVFRKRSVLGNKHRHSSVAPPLGIFLHRSPPDIFYLEIPVAFTHACVQKRLRVLFHSRHQRYTVAHHAADQYMTIFAYSHEYIKKNGLSITILTAPTKPVFPTKSFLLFSQSFQKAFASHQLLPQDFGNRPKDFKNIVVMNAVKNSRFFLPRLKNSQIP